MREKEERERKKVILRATIKQTLNPISTAKPIPQLILLLLLNLLNPQPGVNPLLLHPIIPLHALQTVQRTLLHLLQLLFLLLPLLGLRALPPLLPVIRHVLHERLRLGVHVGRRGGCGGRGVGEAEVDVGLPRGPVLAGEVVREPGGLPGVVPLVVGGGGGFGGEWAEEGGGGGCGV